jgi:hypothetical protein
MNINVPEEFKEGIASIPPSVIAETLELMRQEQYQKLSGIEKKKQLTTIQNNVKLLNELEEYLQSIRSNS